ncbi:MAG: alpha/beta fold hydrolase [Actinomycetota bacterium]|nr:alpha/beta fold hydrolase [Actinomycetota bacterium]
MGGRAAEHFVEAGGLRTRYLALGDSGRPVLLLHGLHGSADHWRWLAPRLPGFTCYAPDLKGHGRSQRPSAGYRYEDYAAHVLGLLDVLGLDAVDVIGTSMGGAVAMWMAVHFPERVGRLVLVCPAGVGKLHAPGVAQFALGAVEILLRTRTRALADHARRTQFADPGSIDPRFFAAKEADALRRRRDPVYRRASLAQYRALLSPAHLDVERIGHPTLVVWGAEDRALPWQMAADGLARIPRARLVVLERSGHLPHVESPDRLASLVAEHLG